MMPRNSGTLSVRLRKQSVKKINFKTIRSYRQYSYMPDTDREAMLTWWCNRTGDLPDREGSADAFFAWLDQLMDVPATDDADQEFDLDDLPDSQQEIPAQL